MTFDQICRFLDTHPVFPRNKYQKPKNRPKRLFCVKCLLKHWNIDHSIKIPKAVWGSDLGSAALQRFNFLLDLVIGKNFNEGFGQNN